MRNLHTPVQYLETSRNLLVLYFSAAWCAPCHIFEPKLAALEPLHPQVLFAKVDVDDAAELADSFNISTVPTVVLIRAGQEVHRVEGVRHKRPGRPVSQAIRKYLLLWDSITDS